MDGLLWLGIVVVAVALFWFRRASLAAGASLTAPTIGFANFGGTKFTPMLNEDRDAFGRMFSKVSEAPHAAVPACDVLFLYADLAPDGAPIGGAGTTVRHLAEQAGAAILVLASPNPGERFAAASERPGPARANLVFTIERKGAGFTRFFRELFTWMYRGKTFPAAWVAICPQHQSAMRPDLPATVALLEGGPVSFKRAGKA